MFTKKEASRIFPYINISHAIGCWEWKKTTWNGYGRIWLRGKNRRVYKVMYEWVFGELPEWKNFKDSKELDHLCNNKLCVNPFHLKLVSHKETTLRGNGVTAVNARKTHCIHGHLLVSDNRGHRKCKTCQQIYEKTEKRRNRKHTKL